MHLAIGFLKAEWSKVFLQYGSGYYTSVGVSLAGAIDWQKAAAEQSPQDFAFPKP
jgi:hypothetical protein